MSEYTGATDKTHVITLTSTIEQVMWSRPLAAPGASVKLDVFTHYVGVGAEVEVELTDHFGTSFGTTTEPMHMNRYALDVKVPDDARTALYANVKLTKHGLSKKSPPLLLLPKIEVTNAAWDRTEVGNQGDFVKLTADVKGAPDGTEAELRILELETEDLQLPITELLAYVEGEQIELEWEFRYPFPIEIPPTPEIDNGTAPEAFETEFIFEVIVAGIKAVSGLLKFIDPFPRIQPKWSKKEVTPDHNSAWPPASPPTDDVPDEAKASLLVETKNIPDDTGAVITIHHCHTGALVPGGTLNGLKVKGDKVIDPNTDKEPEWTVQGTNLPWDPWDKPFFYFKVEAGVVKAETPKDYQNQEDKTLRVLYWHASVSDAIADTPAGGNLTTQAEMAEIAGILEGQTNHKVYQIAVNQNNVPVNLWGSILRNTYAYHQASHGNIVDRDTGSGFRWPGRPNPPRMRVGNWRSVVVLGRTRLGDAEINQAANVPNVPRYLIYMDTCVAGWEPSFGNACIGRGTRNYLAFRCYIPDGDARQMARDFYNKWCGTFKCNPEKIPTVFFDVGAPFYGSMRPILFGAGGGRIKSPLGQALDAIGEAIGGVIDSIIDLFK